MMIKSVISLFFFARSEPLPASKLSSITREAVEEDLYSNVYDDIHKYNKTNSKPNSTNPPTPMPASRNGEYELTNPAYVSIDLKSIPSKETEDRQYEVVLNAKPSISPPLSASRNVEYELITCPAYAPTNIPSKDGHYEIVVNTKPTIPPQMPASRNGGYEMTNCPVNVSSDIQSSLREETEDRL